MPNKRRNIIHSITLVLCLILIISPVASFGQTSVRYGADIKKETPIRFGHGIEKRAHVRYGVDIRAEDIRQVQPGEIIEEIITDFEFDIRNYAKLSGYYDDLKDDPLVNPDNILKKEETGYFLEANTQFKITYLEDYSFSTDISYQYCPGPGAEQEDKNTHFIANEFFLDLFMAQSAYFKAGKKRETWGVGTTFNPVDIMMPPKDPVDPAESREGAYLAMFEVPVGNSSFSGVYFPRVEFDLETEAGQSGIPDEMEMGFDDASYGMRAFFLVWDTDLSFIYYRTDQVPTLMKNYFGVTINRYWGDLGAYFELLGHEGNDMEFVKKDDEGNYYFPKEDVLVKTARADDNIYVNFAVGANYAFSDNTKIGVEYLRNNEGYDNDEFDEFYDFLDHDSKSYLLTHDENIKKKLLKANQILGDKIRRNYLSLTYDRPNTFDDFFPHVNTVICLDDGSFLVNGAVDYTVRDDTTITLNVKICVGEDDTEYGLKPDDFKITLKMKYYF